MEVILLQFLIESEKKKKLFFCIRQQFVDTPFVVHRQIEA